jgi:hypothetical protein
MGEVTCGGGEAGSGKSGAAGGTSGASVSAQEGHNSDPVDEELVGAIGRVGDWDARDLTAGS